MFQNQRILLIGGAGFIGHHLAVCLRQKGASVLVIDNLYHNNYHTLKKNVDLLPSVDLYLKIIEHRLDLLKKNGVELQEIDARDYYSLTAQFTKFMPDVVIHLAAIAHAGKANKDPYTTFDNSLRTLENALDVSRAIAVKHFIYFSSSMVYGQFVDGFVTEETPCHPMGIYGALKFAGEKMVIAYQQVFNLPYTIVRPSALYGERCVSRRVGQVFIENAIQGLEVAINGDGSDRLDFTYISDLVNGIVRVIESENSKNEIFNITYGQARSIYELISILSDFFPTLKVKYLSKDQLMPDRGTLSIEKAKRLLHYEPAFPLEKGFIEYINWYKSIYQT